MSLTEAQRADISERFGSAVQVVDKEGHPTMVFRKPTRANWREYQNATRDPNAIRIMAMEKYCADCLAFPEKDGKPDASLIEPLWEDYPALPETLFEYLGELAGVDQSLITQPEQALVEQYGKKIFAVKAGKHGTLTFRKPTRGAWGMYQLATRTYESDRTAAIEALCVECLIPGKPNAKQLLDAVLEDYPGLTVLLYQRLSTLAGKTEDGLGKL